MLSNQENRKIVPKRKANQVAIFNKMEHDE